MRLYKLLLFFIILSSSTEVNAQAGSFYLNNLTYLPDGGGVQYQTSITVSGFPGVVISTPSDMAMMCLNIEHSFLGDLEIALQCPNGTQATLLNSYSPGFIPGGVSGGGTYLGDPFDVGGGGGPGEGWEYCFSSQYNTWQDYPGEFSAGNTIPAPNFGNGGPSMNPNGIYLPEDDFSAFVGCPMDGQWTILVQDNLAVDDGYIFGWGLNIDPSLLGHFGHVFQDFNEDCTLDNLEGGIDNLTVIINPGNYVVHTNSMGGWYINNLPIGTYTATVDTTTTWLATCSPSTTFTVTDPTIFVQSTSIGMINTNPCSEPDISIVSPFARPCASPSIYVHAQNSATATAIIPNAYVQVTLDPTLTLTSASYSYSALGNNVYQFDIGDLYPGQIANISLITSSSCQAIVGQTLCNEAELFPISPCMLDTIPGVNFPSSLLPDPCMLPWDQSSISVNGWCQNDTIYFEVTNTGDPVNGDMDCYAPVMVFLDSAWVFADSLILDGGESQIYTFPGTGQTWIMDVAQHPLHPGNSNPNAHVELCGDTLNWIPNIINQYPQDDADPVVDINCLLYSQSYDPNDKRGFPLGVTDEHRISRGDDLEYIIRFQNTGTDTAFTVVIRDTLDTQLNLFSVISGASSDSYTFNLLDQNVLEWTFNNILLPDSTTDEPGSHGFVSFKVEQIPNLPYGSIIRNDADIYFDINPPVITNETWHLIYQGYIEVVNLNELITNESTISAYPNPTSSSLRLVVENEMIGDKYIIYDELGRLIEEGVVVSLETELDLGKYEKGHYIIHVGSSLKNVIKLVKW